MERIFLSYRFAPVSPLVASLQDIIESHGIRVETGVDLGGGMLLDEVKRRIDASDGVVALLGRDDPMAGARFRPSSWVEAEVQYGRDAGKRVITMVESLVDTANAYANYERIDVDPAAPLDAVVKLARTVGLWRLRAGRTIRARLAPDAIEKEIGGDAECKFQLQRLGKKGAWMEGSVVPEPGRVFVYLPGIAQDDASFQLLISSNGKKWSSKFTPQDVAVTLETAP